MTRRLGGLFLVLWCLSLLQPPGADAFSRLQTGDSVADLRLEAVTGHDAPLGSRQDDRATILVFWAPWSSRSVAALRDLEALRADSSCGAALEVLAVDVSGEDPGAGDIVGAARFLRERGIELPLYVDADLELYHRYGVVAVPSLAVLDGSWTVRGLLNGYPPSLRAGFHDQVLALLGEGCAPETVPTGKPARPQDRDSGSRPADRMAAAQRPEPHAADTDYCLLR